MHHGVPLLTTASQARHAPRFAPRAGVRQPIFIATKAALFMGQDTRVCDRNPSHSVCE
jgi:hypothetical protein